MFAGQNGKGFGIILRISYDSIINTAKARLSGLMDKLKEVNRNIDAGDKVINHILMENSVL